MNTGHLEFIKQYASEVIDFSSQYGGENPRSVSYCVANIAGEPRIFPAYGDFTQAAVFRTYGPWWNSNNFKRKNTRPKPKSFHGKDYIDLLFEQWVYPKSIAIYETYNPGAVVRILALTQENTGQSTKYFSEQKLPDLRMMPNGSLKWEVLWEAGNPMKNLPKTENESRMFAPALCDVKSPTRIVRLEFCSLQLEYYTELDAVELTGTAAYHLSSSVDPPIRMFNALSISRQSAGDELSPSVKEFSDSELFQKNGYFDTLPLEVLQYIFSFLPLLDLCRCSVVCKLFHRLSYDPSQFVDIDMSECWHLVTDDVLTNIASRCNVIDVLEHNDGSSPTGCQVQAVDLSWCGGGGILSEQSLTGFIEKCSSDFLTRIVLASSPAVTDGMLQKIADCCPNLMHLDIQSCSLLSCKGIGVLQKLNNLQSLNFYRTKIDDTGIIEIINANPNLEGLNLGSCIEITDYDRIFEELSKCCLDLSTVDCWRAKSLTSSGLMSLCKSCCRLTELDLGWCGGLQSNSDCFQVLASQSPHLTKLYVTANRTICDLDIEAIAKNCPKLEKLDILGTRLVSVRAISSLLLSCKNLQFLDVSFCFSFTKEVVKILRQEFPQVSIKRSFQDET